MVGTLFIIGNGFDLNCGMKTRYTDVYKGYVNTKSENAIIKQFKQDIKWDIEKWSDFELAMADYIKQFKNESDFIDCLSDFTEYLTGYLKNEERAFLRDLSNLEIRSAVEREFNNSIRTFYEGVNNNVTSEMKGRSAGSISSGPMSSFRTN